MNLYKAAQEAAYDIRAWDKEDVCELRNLIIACKEACERAGLNLEDVIDTSDLPTVPWPDLDIGHPIRAMDLNRQCLVGADLDEVVDLNKIMKAFR
jgi:hypothetical protein